MSCAVVPRFTDHLAFLTDVVIVMVLLLRPEPIGLVVVDEVCFLSAAAVVSGLAFVVKVSLLYHIIITYFEIHAW